MLACSVWLTCMLIIASPAGPEIAPTNVPITRSVIVPPHFAIQSLVPQSPSPQSTTGWPGVSAKPALAQR